MKNALIFGINGQDGHYLQQLLNKENISVFGLSRNSITHIKGDVSNYHLVEKLIREIHPDYIFHFAAESTTKHDALFDNHKAISTGTINILESVMRYSPDAKVFLSGSAMQFRNSGLPIYENSLFEASSPYAVARIHSVYAGRYYREKFGISVYCGYFFNHDSPLRTERHVNKKITAAVKRIEQGSKEILKIGNLDVQKEFNFAGDIVEAVWLLVNQNTVFEAVIGCGKTYSIKDWTQYCFDKINKSWKDYVKIEKDFLPEYKILVSDPSLIKSIGWEPRLNFYDLADLMMAE